MSTMMPNPMGARKVSAGELTELVRGKEEDLMAKLIPLVRRQDVTLDLHRIRRIDAGGVSALVSLYECAREAGHRFSVTNLSPHVAEILRVVGLKRILQSHIAAKTSQFGMHCERPAARKYPSRLLIPA